MVVHHGPPAFHLVRGLHLEVCSSSSPRVSRKQIAGCRTKSHGRILQRASRTVSVAESLLSAMENLRNKERNQRAVERSKFFPRLKIRQARDPSPRQPRPSRSLAHAGATSLDPSESVRLSSSRSTRCRWPTPARCPPPRVTRDAASLLERRHPERSQRQRFPPCSHGACLRAPIAIRSFRALSQPRASRCPRASRRGNTRGVHGKGAGLRPKALGKNPRSAPAPSGRGKDGGGGGGLPPRSLPRPSPTSEFRGVRALCTRAGRLSLRRTSRSAASVVVSGECHDLRRNAMLSRDHDTPRRTSSSPEDAAVSGHGETRTSPRRVEHRAIALPHRARFARR